MGGGQRERSGGWSRVRGGRSDRDARRARVPSRGTESRELMTRPTVGSPLRAGQSSLRPGFPQPDPEGEAEHLLAWHCLPLQR